MVVVTTTPRKEMQMRLGRQRLDWLWSETTEEDRVEEGYISLNSKFRCYIFSRAIVLSP